MLRWAENLGPCVVSPLAAWSYRLSALSSDAIFAGEVKFLVDRMRQGVAVMDQFRAHGIVSDGWKLQGP